MLRSRAAVLKKSEKIEKLKEVPVPESKKRIWLNIFIGFLFVCIGCRVILWNEESFMLKTLSLDEGMQELIQIENSKILSPENNGKLIHLVGRLQVGEPLAELDYGVSIPAIKLKRRVQMYQWVEEKSQRKLDEIDYPPQDSKSPGTHFYYTEWRDKLIDSNKFQMKYGHDNPRQFPIKTLNYISERVNIGAYYFGDALKDKCIDFAQVTSDDRPERKDIKLHSGIYYHSQDVWNPEIGDIRIQFTYCGLAGDEMTVIAKQNGHELIAYVTKAGHEILILEEGTRPIVDIFSSQHSLFIPWSIRISCFFLIAAGSGYILGQSLNFAKRRKVNAKLCSVLSNNCGSIVISTSLTICFIIVAWTWLPHKPNLSFWLLISASVAPIYLIYIIYVYYTQSNTTIKRNRYQRI